MIIVNVIVSGASQFAVDLSHQDLLHFCVSKLSQSVCVCTEKGRSARKI